jgi:hypothetical protein
LFSAGRPHFYLSHRSLDLSDLSRRLDVLFSFLPPVPPGADVAAQMSDRAYRVKMSKAGKKSRSSPHRFGGTFEGVPPCGNCATPVHLLLTIDTSDPVLSLPDLGGRLVRIVYCFNCASWKPMFVDYSTERLRIIHQEKEAKVNDDPPLDERAVSFAVQTSPTARESRLGGAPTWLQGPEIPDCVRCGKPMAFFGQLRSMPALAFGDSGYLYSFLCTGCEVAATFIQSH